MIQRIQNVFGRTLKRDNDTLVSREWLSETAASWITGASCWLSKSRPSVGG
jgi:hypothetical protein